MEQLTMSLEDIIKKDKPRRGQHKQIRRGIKRQGYQSQIQRQNRSWDDNDNNNKVPRSTLSVSNLHYSVLQPELKELFSEYSGLIKCDIDWDEIGRSKGTATVEFDNVESAEKAISDYDGQELDGQKLSIQIIDSVKKVSKIIKKNDRWQHNNSFKQKQIFPSQSFQKKKRWFNKQ